MVRICNSFVTAPSDGREEWGECVPWCQSDLETEQWSSGEMKSISLISLST